MRRAGLVLVALGVPTTAAAHSRLVEPPSRSEIDFLMEGPCGGEARGEATQYEAGQVVEMRWAATQSHSNSYRVAFSPAGDEGFEENVLGSRPDDPEVFDYVQPVPMPMCTCDDCTLQLRQLTETGMLAYFSCADIELVAPEGMELPECVVEGDSGDPAGSTGMNTGSTSEGTSTSGSTDAAATGSAASTGGELDATDTDARPEGSAAGSGGCSVGDSGSLWAWVGMLAIGGWRRRDILAAWPSHSKISAQPAPSPTPPSPRGRLGRRAGPARGSAKAWSDRARA